MRKHPLLILAISALFPGLSMADWEADVTAVSSKGEFSNMAGRLFSRKNLFRIDTDSPFAMSIFAKSDSSRVHAAIHSFKIRLSSEKFSSRLPACLSGNFDLCIKEFKLKVTGSEKCGDHACDILEGSPKIQGLKKVKLWHWSGEKEPIFSQMLITKNNGAEIRATFANIEKKAHPDSFFSAPTAYKDAGSLENFFGDSQGKSP